MDITTIDAISYATRVGNVAAAELYGLLADGEGPALNWFNPASQLVDDGLEETWLEWLGDQVAELGKYTCINLVDQGERLYRWGGSQGIVPLGEWALLDVAGKQAFEAFVDTVRHTFVSLSVAQQAQANARAAAGVRPPEKPNLEDTIFEREESIFTLRPEAIAAAPLQARLRRETEEAEKRAAAEKAAQDEADAAAVEKKRRADKAAATRAANRANKPAPMSAGETVVAPATNRGGRGKIKQPAP